MITGTSDCIERHVLPADDNRCQQSSKSHDSLSCGRNQSQDGYFKLHWTLVIWVRSRHGKWVGRGGNLALATSFDSSKLALRILHNRWHHECIQSLTHQISTNHRLVLIYMNLAHNIFIGIYQRHIVGGRCVISGVLRVKINSLNAVLNTICLLLTLFGAQYFPRSWLRLSCFVVYWAVNIDKVRECNCYIIYTKIVFSNHCRSKIIW